MSEISKEQLVRDFSKALLQNQAALFVGAGVSAGAGFVDWRGLLRDIASDLNLQVDEEHDLISLAQYEFNRNQNRNRLNAKIIEEFKDRARTSDTHKWIARAPIDTVWTTNYDKLLETAFESISKTVDVKHSPRDLLHRRPYSDVTIFKMHGDIDDPGEAVLIKDDYERYEQKRPMYVSRLQGDLTWRHFLFLGFSFSDPNIDYIFSRLRLLLEENAKHQPPRYCILRRPQKPKNGATKSAKAQFDRDTRHLPHRIDDLARFNIDVVMIDEFREIPQILEQICRTVSASNVFISGSAHEYPLGRDRTEAFCRELGARLIKEGLNLVSGFGLGIAGACIIGAHEETRRLKQTRLGQRLRLFPFPQNVASDAEHKRWYSEIRQSLVKEAGVTIFVGGTKLNATSNTVVIADGILEEFRLAAAEGHVLIPVPCTGGAAEEIWKTNQKQVLASFSGKNVSNEFALLSNPATPNEKLVDAVATLIKKGKP